MLYDDETLLYDYQPEGTHSSCNSYGTPHIADAKIYINGERIPYYIHLSLQQSAVTHHQFVLTLPHDALAFQKNYQDWRDAKNILGTRITIIFSYKRLKNTLTRDFIGIVTDVDFSKKGAPSYGNIIVKGSSPTILLDAAPRTQSFGGDHTVALDFVFNQLIEQATGPKRDYYGFQTRVALNYCSNILYCCQYQETHYNFLARTAHAYGEQFFYDGETLHFGKLPTPEKSLELTFGEDVDSLQIKTNLKHVDRRFYGYNSSTNEVLECGPTQIHHYSQLAKNAYNLSKQTFRTRSVQVAPFRVATPKDVEIAQESMVGSLAAELLIVSGKTYVPFLYPGRRVHMHIRKRGIRDRDYVTEIMITEIHHSITMEGNYVGTFEGITADTSYLPKPIFRIPKTQTELATVIDNADPKHMGRVRVCFDWDQRNQNSSWIRVVSPYAGSSKEVPKNRGFVAIPEKGDRVVIQFLDNNPDRPIVVSSIFNGKTAAGGGPNNNIKSFTSSSGHTLEMDDDAGITLKDKTNQNYVILDGKEKVTFHAKQKVILTNGKAKIIIDGQKISFLADKIFMGNENGPASKISMHANECLVMAEHSLDLYSDNLMRITSDGMVRLESADELSIESENIQMVSTGMMNIQGSSINLIGPDGIPFKEIKKPLFNPIKWEPCDEMPYAVHTASLTHAPGAPKKESPQKQAEGASENAVLFVNGYRFSPTLIEKDDSDNLISYTDRHNYWEGIDVKFAERLNAKIKMYVDGHHSIKTSNHRTMISFYLSGKHNTRIHKLSSYDEQILAAIGGIEENAELGLFISKHFRKVKNISKRNYLIVNTVLSISSLKRSIKPAGLNTKSNPEGFQTRVKSGKIAGQNFVTQWNKLKTQAQKNNQDAKVKVVDIVAHSMGYAYALGMAEVLKQNQIPLGRFYIIAPENAIAGQINLHLFEEVWQYGANLGEPNEDPIHRQDGVAPQTPVNGLADLGKKKPTQYGRAFIPDDAPKGFLQSHKIGNYQWIFKQRDIKQPGYVKPRK